MQLLDRRICKEDIRYIQIEERDRKIRVTCSDKKIRVIG
jgi:hypothetical protein